jgi:hypothetical protein
MSDDLLRRASKRPSQAWLGRVRAEVGVDEVRPLLDAELTTETGDLVRGAVHAIAALAPEEAAPLLLDLARRAGRVPGGSAIAPSPKVAGACIVALGAIGAAPELIELRHEIRHHGLRLDVDAALRAVAEQHGSTIADLLDDYTPPHLLAAHLESLLASSRRWPIATWAARWGASPVAESLVWSSDGDEVWLWHPADGDAAPDDVSERQPFPQVHREVFTVEPHDDPAAMWTNRFAARSLDHRQLMALCKTRGWVTHAAGHWDPDAGGSALVDLDDGAWRATLTFDVLGTGDERTTAERCCTDQIAFARYDVDENAWSVVPIGAVPPRVFSEVLRDMALFVAAAAIDEPNEWRPRAELRRWSWPSSAWLPDSRLVVDGVVVARAPASAARYPR